MAEKSTQNDLCKSAVLAAMELMHDNCGQDKGVMRGLSEDVYVFVPRSAIEEIEKLTDHRFGNPITDSTAREKAIEACMKATWANRLADKMVGAGAPEEVRKQVLRRLCEGLID